MFVSTTPIKGTRSWINTGRRQNQELLVEDNHKEKWFLGNWEKIEVYLHEISRKIINSPKFLMFASLKLEKILDVRRMLKHPKLTRNIYLDLVQVFFTNLTFEGDSMWNHVKGVHMEIPFVWTAMTRFKLLWEDSLKTTIKSNSSGFV